MHLRGLASLENHPPPPSPRLLPWISSQRCWESPGRDGPRNAANAFVPREGERDSERETKKRVQQDVQCLFYLPHARQQARLGGQAWACEEFGDMDPQRLREILLLCTT